MARPTLATTVLWYLGVVTACLGFAAPASALAQQIAPDTLTTTEREVATRAAEGAVQRVRTDAPMYLVAMELVRPKSDEDPRRALVTHYRYDGDMAIRTLVDLGQRQVVEFDSVPHLGVPFVAEEVERARRLALADPRVVQAVEPYRDELKIEVLPLRTTAPDDPFYQRRVLRLLFRVARGYLEEPVVMVDLTAGEVSIEDPR